jgi:RecB family exonuclease
MKTFLGNVARSLYGRYGGDISSLGIVLPNMRSRLFFMDELARVIEAPVWQPSYISVDDLMGSIAGIDTIDRTRAIVELYKVWQRFHDEDFDRFYFWGEMLLGDFDQIDKYMIDADALFGNIRDLKAIGDGLDYLNEEQRAAIARFWAAFGSGEGGRSGEQERFAAVWNTLRDVYHAFRLSLSEQGMGYTGMIHRAAAEKIRAGEAVIPAGAYAIVGFNALSQCEKILFDALREGGAGFFWDSDDYYVENRQQEAGLFLRDNIERYPQPEYFNNETDNFGKPKNVAAVAVASDSMQCKYAAEFIRETEARQGGVGKETAIVLTDEELLVPLLYSIPESVGDINVTMGYPLRQSIAYSFTERLLKLQNNRRERGGETVFYHSDVTGLLSHPFVMSVGLERAEAIRAEIVAKSRVYVKASVFQDIPLLSKIFTPQAGWAELIEYVIDIISDIARREAAGVDAGGTENAGDQSVGVGMGDAGVARAAGGDVLQKEFLGQIAGTLRKLANSLKDCGVDLSLRVASSLARRMLQNVRVPYSGEPLKGLQVMGILETRNLDFENVLILSMNDDNFPGNPSASSSFIPYNLRFAYGLPTPQHHDGVYAYYFYRLLQRAGKVDMAYSSAADEDSTGEPSRYIYQLEYESPHAVVKKNIGIDVSMAVAEPIEVTKTPEVMESLLRYVDGRGGADESGGAAVSPSAFNAYLDCPLKFYFRSIARLKADGEVAEEIDALTFGSILHKAMELLYSPLVGIQQPGGEIEKLIGSEAVDRAVDDALCEIYFNGEEVPPAEYEGNTLLVRDIVRKYINNNILPFDARQGDFTIIALERELHSGFVFGELGQTLRTIRFRGTADRIDMLPGGMLRIIDYKTGSPHRDFAGLAELLGDEAARRNGAVLQTFLYSLMAAGMQERGELPGSGVSPALYYVRMMNAEDYSPLLNHKTAGAVDNYADHREDLEELLNARLTELFDPSVPFTQCRDTLPCRYCDFNLICRRGN